MNDVFKSKGIIANCMSDRASVYTWNAMEQFLHHNRILIPVHIVPEQFSGFANYIYEDEIVKIHWQLETNFTANEYLNISHKSA